MHFLILFTCLIAEGFRFPNPPDLAEVKGGSLKEDSRRKTSTKVSPPSDSLLDKTSVHYMMHVEESRPITAKHGNTESKLVPGPLTAKAPPAKAQKLPVVGKIKDVPLPPPG
jgi:hypothetical protein